MSQHHFTNFFLWKYNRWSTCINRPHQGLVVLIIWNSDVLHLLRIPGFNELIYDFIQSACGNIGAIPCRVRLGMNLHKSIRPMMFFNSDIILSILMSAIVGFAAGERNGTVYKRRLCLQYEMKDHTSSAMVIDRQYYCSKRECMASCTCHLTCNTFHFRETDCTCDLLVTSEMCMSYNVTKGTIWVRLGGCMGIPPWQVVKPSQRKLQWMEPSDVGSQRSIFTTSSNKRQVARVLHEGLFVPGYVLVSSGKFQASAMKGNIIICYRAYQVLTYGQSDDYLWLNFAPGDDVPLSAVVGGYGPDETPLYIIKGDYGVSVKPGFYNAATERIHVKGMHVDPLTLSLLLENY